MSKQKPTRSSKAAAEEPSIKNMLLKAAVNADMYCCSLQNLFYDCEDEDVLFDDIIDDMTANEYLAFKGHINSINCIISELLELLGDKEDDYVFYNGSENTGI